MGKMHCQLTIIAVDDHVAFNGNSDHTAGDVIIFRHENIGNFHVNLVKVTHHFNEPLLCTVPFSKAPRKSLM